MRFTTVEVLSINTGLPALVQVFLKMGEVQRALDLGAVARKLKPEVEIFEMNRLALINAYGAKSKTSQGKKITADTPGFEQYEVAIKLLLEREIKLNIEPVVVKSEEVSKMDPNAFLAISPLLKLGDA